MTRDVSTNTANGQLLEEVLRRSHFLRMFADREAAAIRKFLLKEVIPSLVEQVQRRYGARRGTRRYVLMLEAINSILHEAFVTASSTVRSTLYSQVGIEAQWLTGTLNSVLEPVGLASTIPSTSVLRQVVTGAPIRGELLRDYWRGLERNAKRQALSAINIGLAEGTPTAQVVRNFRQSVDVSRRQAETVVRTAINHTTNQAREQTFRDNTDVIGKVRYVATLDARTSLVCAGLDGRVFPIDSGPRPPQHHQCRSEVVPVLKSWKELGIDLKEAPPGTRASFGGQVPATQTYNAWLRTQSDAFQNRVLGPARAKLFRNGLHLDKFTNPAGKRLTLEELANL